ncbi:MAG: HRDC domain-containing protein [Candidatus Alcyoniella australis]|nr:HRDC domain-containing protein [Candidatus Alcyoniella australis]
MGNDAGKQVRLLTLRFDKAAGCFDDRELRRFCDQHHVLQTEQQFFAQDGEHFMAVTVIHSGAPQAKQGAKPAPEQQQQQRSRPKGDAGKAAPGSTNPKQKQPDPADPYNELDQGERKVYEALRAWRTQIAEKQSLPRYAVAKNSHLARIVKLRPQSRDDLAVIEGFGLQRVERYGAQIIDVLAREQGNNGRARAR